MWIVEGSRWVVAFLRGSEGLFTVLQCSSVSETGFQDRVKFFEGFRASSGCLGGSSGFIVVLRGSPDLVVVPRGLSGFYEVLRVHLSSIEEF